MKVRKPINVEALLGVSLEGSVEDLFDVYGVTREEAEEVWHAMLLAGQRAVDAYLVPTVVD